MGEYTVFIIPTFLDPFPEPPPHKKPELLPGLWLENMTDSFASVARQIPPDTSVMELRSAIVVDYPAYVQGLLQRLHATEPNAPVLLKELAARHQDQQDGYAQHPLEVDVEEEDIRKLILMSCILSGDT